MRLNKYALSGDGMEYAYCERFTLVNILVFIGMAWKSGTVSRSGHIYVMCVRVHTVHINMCTFVYLQIAKGFVE